MFRCNAHYNHSHNFFIYFKFPAGGWVKSRKQAPATKARLRERISDPIPESLLFEEASPGREPSC